MPLSRAALALFATVTLAGSVVHGVVGTPSAALAAPAAAPTSAEREKVSDGLKSLLNRAGAGDEVAVIVTLARPASPTGLARLQRDVGQLDIGRRFRLLPAFSARLRPAAVRALAAHPYVVAVEQDAPVQAFNDSAQDAFGVTQARLDVPGLDGDGDGDPTRYAPADLVAAVIDTGIDPDHLDLDGGKVIAFADLVNGQPTAYDDNGHGSHVAGTIAGDGDGRADKRHRGVAPAAALVGVKVLDSAGSGTTSDIVAGLEWVVANKDLHGIEVVNLSLGSNGCYDGTDTKSRAVDAAVAAGLVVTVAAGNAGPGTCTIGSPGVASGAITVGAMADTGVNGFKQAHFSGRGPTADGRIKPDLSAPGVSVTSARAGTTSDYRVMSGTSMATPFVAGVALLMRDAAPSLTPDQVRAALRTTAVDWGVPGADIDYGAGRLDAYAALAASGAAGLVSPPAVPVHAVVQGSLPGTAAVSDHRLEVSDTTFPIAATLVHPGFTTATSSSPDFDLVLLDPSGTAVAKAETNRRQDELGYSPTTTGTYVLRVTSYSGSGDYVLDLSAGVQPATPDTTAPEVLTADPGDSAIDVPAGASVAVTFSEGMDQDATAASFTLTKTDEAQAVVAGALAWNATTLTLDPGVDLEASTSYTATVSIDARDVAGNALAAPYTWSFTTAAAPAAVKTVTAFATGTKIETGRYRKGGLADLEANDSDYFRIYSSSTNPTTSSWYASFTGVTNGLLDLAITYEGKSSKSCQQTVSVWNWATAAWEKLDSRSVLGSRTLTGLRPSGALSSYVSGDTGDGEVRVQARCARTSGTFTHSTDVLRISYDRT
jgi:serine protease AprX